MQLLSMLSVRSLSEVLSMLDLPCLMGTTLVRIIIWLQWTRLDIMVKCRLFVLSVRSHECKKCFEYFGFTVFAGYNFGLWFYVVILWFYVGILFGYYGLD